MVIQHLKQIGKVKKLDKWVPHQLTKNLKKKSFWSIIFFCSVQQWWTISWSDCNVRRKVDFIWQLVTISLVVRLRRSSKAFSKPNFHQKEIMVTVWWSAVSLIHYSFLNPRDIITSEKYSQQINEMHQKLQCLRLALANRMGPILLHNNAWPHITQPMLQRLN